MKLIKNGTIWSMADIMDKKMDILVEDGIITKIEENIDEKDYTDIEVYNAEGKQVLPGFIDAHTQLGIDMQVYRFEGADSNELSGPILPQLRAIDAIKIQDIGFDMARHGGVTSVITGPGNSNIIGGTCAAIKTDGKTLDDYIIEEEMCFQFVLSQSPRATYGSKDVTPNTRMGSAALLREALLQAREYKRALETDKAPKFDIKLDSLMRVFDGMLVKIHANIYTDIKTAISIGEEFDLNYVIVGCGDVLLAKDELINHDVPIILGSLIASRRDYESRGFSPFVGGKLEKENLAFSVTTAHPDFVISQLRAEAILYMKEGLSYEEALRSLTILPAQMMEIDDKVGSLEVGKDADIVIWDNNPLDYYSKVDLLLINGEESDASFVDA